MGAKEEKKRNKTIVGTMLGLYIFENKGQKILKRSDVKDDVIFYPKNEVILTKALDCKENGYIIMPCTFEVYILLKLLGFSRRAFHDLCNLQ
jgi:hypothetical protein